MTELFRDAPIGQIIRYFTGNKFLLYPEESSGFQCPASYDTVVAQEPATFSPSSISAEAWSAEYNEKAEGGSAIARGALERFEGFETTARDVSSDLEKAATRTRENSGTKSNGKFSGSHRQAGRGEAYSPSKVGNDLPQPIVPQRLGDGTILVTWYTTDDSENPQNWSSGKKLIVGLQISLYTFAVYMGSAIYTASGPAVMQKFGVSADATGLGLSLYVLAYGIGPLIFAPLSEIPAVGRNWPYMITMAIFVILCVPTALVNNFAGLLVLRFLQGFFGSPCLATGGASLGDMYSFVKVPYMLCLWALGATGGPSLGPLISGFSVPAKNWRWSLWEILWLSGPIFVVMLLFLPETSSPNILLHRARRLRRSTGNDRLKAQSEIDQANMNAKELAFEALVRPVQLIVMDPAIGFTAGYVALCYGIYYSFFEAFPLVYIDKYGFNPGEMGLTFLSIIVGTVVSIFIYYAYLYYVVEPSIRAHGLGLPEQRLIPALLASLLLPIGLFIFGWTGNGKTHWIVSVVGIVIFSMGMFTLMQCIFVYLPLVYPQYAASLFAGNDFARSALAFAAVMFSRPMFTRLGIGSGTSLLGALTATCIAGIFTLYFFGARLRAKSRFSAK